MNHPENKEIKIIETRRDLEIPFFIVQTPICGERCKITFPRSRIGIGREGLTIFPWPDGNILLFPVPWLRKVRT
jgi:hypothetical protein